jgi:hypothetical protein
MQRARLQARLGSKASREEKSAELTVPQLTALCGRYGLDRNGAKADMVSRLRGALAPAHWARQRASETKLGGVSCALALKVPEAQGSCATSTACARRARLQEELVARLCDALSNAGQPAEKPNFSKAEVLKALGLPEMQNLLRQKRLRWVGHALRRKDGDLS